MPNDPKPPEIQVETKKIIYQIKLRNMDGLSIHRIGWEKIEKATQLLYDYRWKLYGKKFRNLNRRRY